jgi:hypothetical protein
MSTRSHVFDTCMIVRVHSEAHEALVYALSGGLLMFIAMVVTQRTPPSQLARPTPTQVIWPWPASGFSFRCMLRGYHETSAVPDRLSQPLHGGSFQPGSRCTTPCTALSLPDIKISLPIAQYTHNSPHIHDSTQCVPLTDLGLNEESHDRSRTDTNTQAQGNMVIYTKGCGGCPHETLCRRQAPDCERSAGTVFQLPNPDAIYSRDEGKERRWLPSHVVCVRARSTHC